MLPDLMPAFASTRESLRAVACYAVSPARNARTGRIGLRPHDGGIATPPFDDGTRIAVRGDVLQSASGESVRLTTLSAAADLLGVELSADPGVGHDLPELRPETDLAVDSEASLALGAWYSFAERVLAGLGEDPASGTTISEAQLWPEHFDLAVTVSSADATLSANVGFSPGDRHHDEPYVYVGPFDAAALDRSDAYWNAPFGALISFGDLAAAPEPEQSALQFVGNGLARLRL